MLKEFAPNNYSPAENKPSQSEGQLHSLDAYLPGDGAALPELSLSKLALSGLDVSKLEADTDVMINEVPLPRMGSTAECSACSANDGTCADFAPDFIKEEAA